jgi:hypothetical protein
MMNLKQNVTGVFSKKFDTLMQINPQYFTINESPYINTGFIQHELVQSFPDSTHQIDTDENGDPIYAFDYMPVIALLVNCVKDLQNRILQLESI